VSSGYIPARTNPGPKRYSMPCGKQSSTTLGSQRCQPSWEQEMGCFGIERPGSL
jgi:hypothetical protein